MLGVVVNVMTEEPMIKSDSLTAILTAIEMPSLVTVSFQILSTASPGVKNRLNTKVITSRNKIAFMPRTIKRNGTWDSLIENARNRTATR